VTADITAADMTAVDMTAVDLIAADMAKGRSGRTGVVAWAALTGVAAAAAGLGLRADYIGVDTFAYWLKATGMIVLLAACAWVALAPGSASRWRLLWTCVSAALLVSLVHEGLPLGWRFADGAVFWRATGTCFAKGFGTSLALSLILTYGIFRWRPLPSLRWQIAAGVVAGLAGVTMLTLHCDSPDPAHIVLGHWAQGLPLVLWTVCLQRWLLARRVRVALGDAAPRLKGIAKISDY
jgi:hypothetical protein